MDVQDRRYLAQCVQHLSSSSLAKFLDLLLEKHPQQVVERMGGESYHIDFGTLSPAAYADAQQFIKTALKDDDDHCCFNENDQRTSASSNVATTNQGTSNSSNIASGYQFPYANKPILADQQTALSSSAVPRNREKSEILTTTSGISSSDSTAQVSTQNRPSNSEATPALAFPKPLPGAARQQVMPIPTGSAGSVQTNTFSPEKSSTKIKRLQPIASEVALDRSTRASTRKNTEQRSPEPKRQRNSESPNSDKKEESRYYNGERVWRHKSEDLHFDFHGIDVILINLGVATNRPWKCGTCGKAFVSKDKIVNHVQQHSGEKLHECPVCKGKFSSKHYLKEHQKRVHLFDCHHCDEVFDTFDELHEHSQREHADQASLKSCSCKKGCNNSRCSCFKNGLNCNNTCQCNNCNNRS